MVWFGCCARAIINAGIVRIFLKRGGGAKSDKWLESAARSEMMFEEAGVSVQYYDDVTII